MNRRLRLNVSAFHYEYDDLQLSNVVPAGILTLNAASAEIDGAELELTALPDVGVGALTIYAGLSLLDAEYKDFTNAPFFVPNPFSAPPPGVVCNPPSSASPGGNSACQFDASGADMIRAPDWTASLSVDYSVSISRGELRLNATYHHNDGFAWEPSNRTRQDAYDVVNARIMYLRDNWRFWVYGRNLSDELYYEQLSEQALGDIGSAAFPRTYGVGLGYTL
jgi:iron complex outermembrane receptor protein